MRLPSCHAGWTCTTSSSLLGPFSTSSCPCEQSCHGVRARMHGTQSLASTHTFAKKSASTNESLVNIWPTELLLSQECALLPEKIFRFHKLRIPLRNSGSNKNNFIVNYITKMNFTDVEHSKFQAESMKSEAFDGNWLELCWSCGFYAISVFGRESDGLER